ncbi:ankyrin repeat domain-containing protein [Brachyspira hyodysenteriae]|nr:ankyrin repeat domain-containing protein [Brachyspira hyodysenteriae]MDA0030162.1 ankyrin repeat domain-containing protein [Brachyspira hyodysenteriae]
MSDIVEYVKNNDIENVRKCLEADNTLADARDEESKFTLLMICAKKGYFDIAKLLVEEGANLNARSRTGITALMFACARSKQK